jgi:hypothetical protein
MSCKLPLRSGLHILPSLKMGARSLAVRCDALADHPAFPACRHHLVAIGSLRRFWLHVSQPSPSPRYARASVSIRHPSENQTLSSGSHRACSRFAWMKTRLPIRSSSGIPQGRNACPPMHHSLPPDPARCCRVMQLQRCHGSMPIGSMLVISTCQTYQLQMDERSIMGRTTPKRNTPFGLSDTSRASSIYRIPTQAPAPLSLQCLSACWDAASVGTYQTHVK